MESSIIRQREEEEADQGGAEGGGGYLGTALPSGPRGGGRRGHGEARYESDCPGMCYLTSALSGESVSGQQKSFFFFLGGGGGHSLHPPSPPV